MYRYEDMKPSLLTSEGLDMFIRIRDRAHRLLAEAGAFTCWAAIRGTTGDSWTMLACVDMLVERGEIREVTRANVAGQDRVFVKGSS